MDTLSKMNNAFKYQQNPTVYSPTSLQKFIYPLQSSYLDSKLLPRPPLPPSGQKSGQYRVNTELGFFTTDSPHVASESSFVDNDVVKIRLDSNNSNLFKSKKKTRRASALPAQMDASSNESLELFGSTHKLINSNTPNMFQYQEQPPLVYSPETAHDYRTPPPNSTYLDAKLPHGPPRPPGSAPTGQTPSNFKVQEMSVENLLSEAEQDQEQSITEIPLVEQKRVNESADASENRPKKLKKPEVQHQALKKADPAAPAPPPSGPKKKDPRPSIVNIKKPDTPAKVVTPTSADQKKASTDQTQKNTDENSQSNEDEQHSNKLDVEKPQPESVEINSESKILAEKSGLFSKAKKRTSNTPKVPNDKSSTPSNENKKEKAQDTKKDQSETTGTEPGNAEEQIDQEDPDTIVKLELPSTYIISHCICVSILSIVEIILQIVLIASNGALYSTGAGIWAGIFGLGLEILTFLKVKTSENHIYHKISIFLHFVGIFVFMVLAIINSYSLYSYKVCTDCYNSNMLIVNVILVILGVFSYALCIIFVMKIWHKLRKSKKAT